jgi:dTDP-4-amino-4,6-dideoxy-D-galactose acyltransferase
VQIREDTWLSGILGMPCFALLCPDAMVSADEVASCVRATAPSGRAFWFTKVAVDDPSVAARLSQAGFDLVDTNVVLAREARAAGNVTPMNADVACELATSQDAEEVAELAARCFRFSRFHADHRLAQGQADEIKRQWARNACRGRSPEIYIARASRIIVGFLAPLLVPSPTGSVAVIDLIGVDPTRQSGGVGSALSKFFINRWAQKSIGLRVGTQIANVPALRLYGKLGFRIANASYVLHGHSHEGRLAP